MPLPQIKGARAREIWRRLSAVTDPELDEPITDMGFVERLSVSPAGEVEVDFRLPTYWCSPNFAFLMADGIWQAAAAPAFVRRVSVRLLDHCFGDKVNAAVNDRAGFAESFAALTDGDDLAEVRRTFREKAFFRRQEAVILGLKAAGWQAEAILGLTLAAYDQLNLSAWPEAAQQKPRYRQILAEEGLACFAEDPVFVDFQGIPLTPGEFERHLMRLRGIRINMEFNGAMCRGLAAARYKEADLTTEEPQLIDFMLGRVPPRDQSARP